MCSLCSSRSDLIFRMAQYRIKMAKLISIFVSLCAVGFVAADCPFSQNNATASLPNWGAEFKQELKDLMAERREDFGRLIDNVAYRGTPLQDYRLTLRDLNLLMRRNYAEMIEKVGRNIYPVIVANDALPEFAGVGTAYTLYLADGTRRHIAPTSPEYEMNKDLAHMALGLYSIVSAYFRDPTSVGWHEKLRQYQRLVQEALTGARRSGYVTPPEVLKICGEKHLSADDQIAMLTLVDGYIRDSFENKSVDYSCYANFTATFSPFVQRALNCAADLQVFNAMPALQKWKDELGAEWRNLYVLIPVIWPVAGVNPRQRIFETLMDEDRRLTHILKLEGATNDDEARTTMGRIVGDRTLAQLVFGAHTDALLELNMALSTRRDLVASASNRAIEDYIKEHGKPTSS